MKHHHSHTALLIIALAITVFVYGLYGFMYHNVNTSLTYALTAKEDVRKEQMYKDQGKSLTDVYDTTVADRAKLATLFSQDSDKVKFIEMLESLGNYTGAKVTITSISADDLSSATLGSTGHIVAHLDVEGTWSGIMRTLIYAENLQYKSSVSAVHMTSSGSSDPKNPSTIWHLSFVLDTLSIHSSN